MSTAVRPFSAGRLEQPRGGAVRKSKTEFRDLTLMLCDLIALLVGALLLIQFRFHGPWQHHASNPRAPHLAIAAVYALLTLLCFHWQNLYRRFQMKTDAAIIFAVAKACTMAIVILTAVLYFTHSDSEMISRGIVLGLFFIGVAIGSTLRLLRRQMIAQSVAAGKARNLLIVGAQPSGRAFAEYLNNHKHFGYRVVGFLDSVRGADVLGELSDIRSVVLSNFVDEVIVAAPPTPESVRFLASELVGLDTGVSVLPETYEAAGFNTEVETVGTVPRLVLRFTRLDAPSLLCKRIIDLLVSSVLLALVFPAMVIIAIAIRWDSRGAVFYYSERVGRKGRLFRCYKFRTMVSNADQLRASLNHLNEREGVLFKITNDPRITRVGRFLRKYSLDELPQLWNVFRGDMSLVGPRPALPSEVREYSPEHVRRMMVPPGITGLWQVHARQSPSFDTYIDLDLEYVEKWSILLDLRILMKTVAVVLAGTGS